MSKRLAEQVRSIQDLDRFHELQRKIFKANSLNEAETILKEYL